MKDWREEFLNRKAISDWITAITEKALMITWNSRSGVDVYVTYHGHVNWFELEIMPKGFDYRMPQDSWPNPIYEQRLMMSLMTLGELLQRFDMIMKKLEEYPI